MESQDTKNALYGFFTVTFAGVVLALVLFFATLYSAFFSGLAAWQLYQWFIRGTFEMAPDLNGYHIIGILMFLHLGLASRETKIPDDKKENQLYKILMGLVTPPIVAAMTVFAGWIIAKAAGLI